MIYTPNEGPAVGSTPPVGIMKGLPNLYERPALTPYFDAQLWKTGTGALITGPPGSGKTRTGVALLKAVYKVEPILQQYWTEHDFLADLRYLWRLEDLTKNDRNEMLWMEYVEWEQAFWGFKQCPFLFLDNVGEGYTAMHRYEVMNLLRLRLDMALPTVVAVDSSQMESLTPQFKSLLIRSAVMVGVSGDGEG